MCFTFIIWEKKGVGSFFYAKMPRSNDTPHARSHFYVQKIKRIFYNVKIDMRKILTRLWYVSQYINSSENSQEMMSGLRQFSNENLRVSRGARFSAAYLWANFGLYDISNVAPWMSSIVGLLDLGAFCQERDQTHCCLWLMLFIYTKYRAQKYACDGMHYCLR